MSEKFDVNKVAFVDCIYGNPPNKLVHCDIHYKDGTVEPAFSMPKKYKDLAIMILEATKLYTSLNKGKID